MCDITIGYFDKKEALVLLPAVWWIFYMLYPTLLTLSRSDWDLVARAGAAWLLPAGSRQTGEL